MQKKSKRWRSNTISSSIKIFGKTLDKQNVPLAVKLLQLFIDDVDHQNLPPGLRDLAPAFQIMKVVCTGILSFFAYPKSSLDE